MDLTDDPRGDLAKAIQVWQDRQWQVPLCTLPPTHEAYSLADHLIGEGWTHEP